MGMGKLKRVFEDFKKFAFTGNVMDLAVGVMIGGAFSSIVTSLVNDVFMPLIGAVTGGVDFTNLFIPLDGSSYATLADAKAAGASTLNYGSFIQSIFSFLMLALCVFFFLRLITKLRKPSPSAPAPRKCPYCRTEIDHDATRCPNCTAMLNTPDAQALEVKFNA